MAGILRALQLFSQRVVRGASRMPAKQPTSSIENESAIDSHVLRDALLTATLSDAVYGKSVADVRARLPCGYNLEHVRFQSTGSKLSPQWLIVTDTDTVYVLFRGRKSAIDTLVSALLATDELRIRDVGTLRVHAGVLRHLQPFLSELLHDLSEVMYRTPARVRLAGHSLGGSYAQIFALLLLRHQPQLASVLEVFAFGSPLVIATPPGRLRANPLFDRVHLFVNNADIVPRLLGSDATGVFLARLLRGRVAVECQTPTALTLETNVAAESSVEADSRTGTEIDAAASAAAGAAGGLASAAAHSSPEGGIGSPPRAATPAARQVTGLIPTVLGSFISAAHKFHCYGHVYMIRHTSDAAPAAATTTHQDEGGDERVREVRKRLRSQRVYVCEVSEARLQDELSTGSGLDIAGQRAAGEILLEDHRLYSYIAALQVAVEQFPKLSDS